MKNREKYRDEILLPEWATPGEFCEKFIEPKILKPNGRNCNDTNCYQCNLFQMLWLDEEYTEPEIDWNKVPVDTPILVSKDKSHWFRRYFARYENNKVFTWVDGLTSWTVSHDEAIVSWICAKLPEVDECEN